MQPIRLIVACAACVAAVLWVALGTAQDSNKGDYLEAGLRARVEALKQEALTQPTNATNLGGRLDTLWAWINAYALTGGPMPVNATLQIATAFRSVEQRRLEGGEPTAAVLRSVDLLIYEFGLKDDRPGALGEVKLQVDGPVYVDSWTTIKQTYTVGEAALGPGSSIMAAKQLQADGGWPQNEDPGAPHYLSASSSNPRVRIGRTSVPWTGMHGGFRAPRPMPAFQVEQGTLRTGDTLTLVYGDRQGGSEGWLQQTFSTDESMLPLYVDIDGTGRFLTPRWPAYAVVGAGVAGVTAVAPSIVKPGETFDLSIRWEDRSGNRATVSITRRRHGV